MATKPIGFVVESKAWQLHPLLINHLGLHSDMAVTLMQYSHGYSSTCDDLKNEVTIRNTEIRNHDIILWKHPTMHCKVIITIPTLALNKIIII